MSSTARGTSPHPGVIVIQPTSRRAYFALRYTDPVTGSERHLRQPADTDAEAAKRAAIELVARLREHRSAPPAQSAPAPRSDPRTKAESKHPGVVIIPPRGRAFYSLRYRDPITGRTKEPSLPGVTTAPAAHDAAVTLSKTLQRRALEVTLAGGREHVGSAHTLGEEIKEYLQSVSLKERNGKRTSKTTLRRYRDGLQQFAAWCESRGVTHVSQLARATLADWRKSRQLAPARGGLRRTSTVNQELKPVRQMLVAAAREGRLVHISSDVVREALKRLDEGKHRPRCYSVVEVRAALRAALDYDIAPSKPRSEAPVAPVVAVALLTGMRRGELAALQCRDVLFDAASDYDPDVTTGLNVIRLPDHKTKTGVARDVLMDPYSPMLTELMHALRTRRPGHERVFGFGYIALGDVAKRLRDFGAPPKFQWKDLRSTCATYQSPLPGNLKAKADRQGHTLAVAEKHYLALPTGTPLTAPDLETVMKCAPELREVIARALAA